MSAPANEPDHTASTQQFQAFVERGEQEPTKSRSTRTTVVATVLVAVVVVALAATML